MIYNEKEHGKIIHNVTKYNKRGYRKLINNERDDI
jgi:hypothetical protein